jgi:CRP-like cAMP-binding protein
MQDLIRHIKRIIPISNEEEALVKYYFESVTVEKNAFLLKDGMVCQFIYFLSDGFVKGFQYQDGNTTMDHLLEKDSFFTSLESFMGETPSKEMFQTTAPSILYRISKSNFNELNHKSKVFYTLSQHIINASFSCKIERVQDFQVLSAKERYKKLLHQHPTIVQHFSVQDLASYLGIASPSLSRIRKEIRF